MFFSNEYAFSPNLLRLSPWEILDLKHWMNLNAECYKTTPLVKTLLKHCPVKVEGEPAKKICFPAKFEIRNFPCHVSVVFPLKCLFPRQKICKFHFDHI